MSPITNDEKYVHGRPGCCKKSICAIYSKHFHPKCYTSDRHKECFDIQEDEYTQSVSYSESDQITIKLEMLISKSVGTIIEHKFSSIESKINILNNKLHTVCKELQKTEKQTPMRNQDWTKIKLIN